MNHNSNLNRVITFMKAIHNLVPSISVVLLSFLKALKILPPGSCSGFKSGIILCTFPTRGLVVNIYVAESSGWKQFSF